MNFGVNLKDLNPLKQFTQFHSSSITWSKQLPW